MCLFSLSALPQTGNMLLPHSMYTTCVTKHGQRRPRHTAGQRHTTSHGSSVYTYRTAKKHHFCLPHGKLCVRHEKKTIPLLFFQHTHPACIVPFFCRLPSLFSPFEQHKFDLELLSNEQNFLFIPLILIFSPLAECIQNGHIFC